MPLIRNIRRVAYLLLLLDSSTFPHHHIIYLSFHTFQKVNKYTSLPPPPPPNPPLISQIPIETGYPLPYSQIHPSTLSFPSPKLIFTKTPQLPQNPPNPPAPPRNTAPPAANARACARPAAPHMSRSSEGLRGCL